MDLERHGSAKVLEIKLLSFNCLQDDWKDCYKQDWSPYVTNSNRLHKFVLFKTQHCPETYLQDVPVPAKTEYTRFRMGVSDINCHSKRHMTNDDISMLCPLCGLFESEEHFLFECPKYEHFRPHFLKCDKAMYSTKFAHVMMYTNVVL